MEVSINALDNMGSILWANNNGSPSTGFAYSPFGSTPARNANNSMLPGFNGERLDPVCQTYHLGNGYRTYNPVLMRANAPDSWSPFGAGGLNQYAYCEGDPINRSDPSGHMSWQAGLGLGLGILGMLGSVFTFGQSLTAAAAAEAAMTASMAADLIVTGSSVAASVTSIASAATEKSHPEASRILGWVSFSLGIPGAISGVAKFSKTIYSKLNKRTGPFNVVYERFGLPEKSHLLGAGANTLEDSGSIGPQRSRALSFDGNLSPMSNDFYWNDADRNEYGEMNYLSDSERESQELVARHGGVFYKKSGQPNPDDDFVNYVYSADRKLYVHFALGHSEISGGTPVLSAGNLNIKGGLITSINNSSGHYKPTNENFTAAMRDMFSRNLIASSTLISARGERPVPAGILLNKWATLV